EHPADLVDRADDGDALDAARAQSGIVVDEPDHTLTGRLAEFAQHAAAAAAGADEYDAARVASHELAKGVCDAALPEPGDADQHRAEQKVDQKGAAREPIPRNRRPDEEERGCLREEDGRDDRHCVARTCVPPHSAVQPEEDEEDVPGYEEHRQREIEDVSL